MNVTDSVSLQDSIDLPNEQGRPSPTSSAPLAGECSEQHSYHADGSAEIRGGEEVMRSAYGLMRIAGNPELYGLMKTNVASNGKPDCGGRVTAVEPGDTRFTYLRREGPHEFATCSVSSKPLRCFGTPKRRKPPG